MIRNQITYEFVKYRYDTWQMAQALAYIDRQRNELWDYNPLKKKGQNESARYHIRLIQEELQTYLKYRDEINGIIAKNYRVY